MSLPQLRRRPLPDFLKQGDPTLGLGQSKPKARDPRIVALATEAVLPGHDPSGRNEAAGLQWLRHVLAGRTRKGRYWQPTMSDQPPGSQVELLSE